MKVRISSILTGFFGLTLIVSFAVFIGFLVYSLRTDSFEGLHRKYHSILNLNEKIFTDIVVRNRSLTASLGEDFMVIKAFVDLNSGLQSSDLATINKIFKPKEGDRSKIKMGEGVEMYEFMHEAHHTQITKYMNTSFFFDIVLVSAKGQVIYSFRKEDEFAQNISKVAGAMEKMRLMQVLLKKVKKKKQVASGIFKGKGGYGFLSVTPIEIKKKLAGYVATVMPLSYVGRQLNDVGVLGKTGVLVLGDETGNILIGSKAVKQKKLAKPTLESAKSKTSTIKLVIDDVGFYKASRKIKLLQQDFYLQVRQSGDEIFKSSNSLLISLVGIGLSILVFVILVVIFGLRKMMLPLIKVTDALKVLAKGEAKEIEKVGSRFKEISQISDALLVFQKSIIERDLLEETVKSERLKEIQKQEELENLLLQFRQLMKHSLSSITEKSTEMKEGADTLISVATSSATEALSAKENTQKASEGVQSVADSATQLSQSIQQVSSHTKHAGQIISAANDAAESTGDCVAELSEATNEIGNVLDIVRGIAQKINLLALNATIEAVHAGEAGKSFSIVASEVKQLSDETSSAIDKIAKQIDQVKNSADYAIGLIKIITHSVSEVTETADAISTAVIEQSDATGKISNEAGLVAEESSIVSENVENVASSIKKTSEVANQVISISKQFTTLSDRLSMMATAFLDDVEHDLEQRRASIKEDVSKSG